MAVLDLRGSLRGLQSLHDLHCCASRHDIIQLFAVNAHLRVHYVGIVRRDGSDHFVKLPLIEDLGLSSCFKANHQDLHLVLHNSSLSKVLLL